MKRKRTGGFTLIEVLVAVAVLIILGGALTMLLRSGLTTWRHGQARMSNDERAQMVINLVNDDMAAIHTRDGGAQLPAIIQLPTKEVLERQRVQYGFSSLEDTILKLYSNEWCRITCSDGANSAFFLFELPFVARSAQFWLNTSGDIALYATIYDPDGGENTVELVPDWNGDLTNRIANGAVAIRMEAQLQGTRGTVIQATEGPVLRFVASPAVDAPSSTRLLLHQDTGQPQKAVFVRDFGARGLGEVCYLTTFDEIEPGEPSPVGKLWRAERREEEDGESFFDGEFIDDIQTLADSSDGRLVYTRAKMEQHGFELLAENVLYFGMHAWIDGSETDDPAWLDDWDETLGIPRKMRMVLVLLPQTGNRTITTLQESLNGGTTTPRLRLYSAEGFTWFSANSAQQRFVKVVSADDPLHQEWICYDNVSGSSLIYDGDGNSPLALDFDRPYMNNRGLRGTEPYAHPAGSEVYHGETYVRTFRMPAPRPGATDE